MQWATGPANPTTSFADDKTNVAKTTPWPLRLKAVAVKRRKSHRLLGPNPVLRPRTGDKPLITRN